MSLAALGRLLARASGALPVRAALLAASALTALALAAPHPVLPQRVFDGIAVLDITQSMNTLDALLDGQPASRLAFANARLRRALPRWTGLVAGMAVWDAVAAVVR